MNTHLIWVSLIVISIASFALAEDSMQPMMVAVILCFTCIKAAIIIDGFMELHQVKHIVRRALQLYCPVLALLIWGILQL